MHVLVTGSKGMLARDVCLESLSRGWRLTALSRTDMDVTRLELVWARLTSLKPDVVVNCAAYTKVDQSEVERGMALSVNALGARNLAAVCRKLGIVLAHISTDYVFGNGEGTPRSIYDPCDPVNYYGNTKYIAERFLETIAPAHYVVRTSWLFGPGPTNFVRKILEQTRRPEPILAVDDQWGSPTYTADLARAIADLLLTDCYGIYHVANSGATTWFEFAREIVRQSGQATAVMPVASAHWALAAPRPAYSVLDPFPLEETIGYLLPHWGDALTRYLARLASGDPPGQVPGVQQA